MFGHTQAPKIHPASEALATWENRLSLNAPILLVFVAVQGSQRPRRCAEAIQLSDHPIGGF
jgi:hypothetical protein